MLKDFADKINESDRLSGEIIVQSFNGKNTYRPKLPEDFLKLKLTNYFIKRIYKISQADRRMIIRQIKTILEDGSPYGLLKLDISNFYESINFKKMIAYRTTPVRFSSIMFMITSRSCKSHTVIPG